MKKSKINHLIKYKVFLNKYYSINPIKKLVLFFIKKIWKYLPLTPQIKKEKCDILFLYGYPKEQERTKKLFDLLLEKGYLVKYDFIQKNRFIKNGYLDKRVNTNIIVEANEALYLVEKYMPKVIVTFSHNSVISVPLRDYLNKKGGKLINIAHSVLGSEYDFSMFYFDYYFVFGQSSYQNALKNKNRFGDTKIVKTGSIFIDDNLNSIPYKKEKKILFFSTWLAESVKDILINNTKLVVAWAKSNPDYILYIKLHHLEKPDFIVELTRDIENIVVMKQSTSMYEALSKVSMVFTSWSNASIEAALATKPVVIVNVSNEKDEFLYLEDFFPKRSKNIKEIENTVKEVFNNYEQYRRQCIEYVKFHYQYKTNINNIVADTMDKVIQGDKFDCTPIKGNFNEC